jgi:hypothetical protein
VADYAIEELDASVIVISSAARGARAALRAGRALVAFQSLVSIGDIYFVARHGGLAGLCAGVPATIMPLQMTSPARCADLSASGRARRGNLPAARRLVVLRRHRRGWARSPC